MKNTKENIEILKLLGFTCDMDKTKDERDEDWYSLKSGWGFRLDAVKDFKTLIRNLEKYKYEEGYEDCAEKVKGR